MPHVVTRDGANISYDRFDPRSGRSSLPVVLLMGLGMNGRIWSHAVEGLGRRGHPIVVVDNRGCGRSSAPWRPWSTATMADDCVQILDDEGIRRAHVVGASMGGMIAQELALRHPERVATLVLGCTTPGLPRIDLLPRRGLLDLALLGLDSAWPRSRDGRVRRALRLSVSRAFAERVTPADEAWRRVEEMLADPISPRGYANQFAAAARHAAWTRLRGIAAPTQVQHGTADRLMPFAAGRALAQRIPGAEFAPIDGAGHALILERPDEVVTAAAEFLARHP